MLDDYFTKPLHGTLFHKIRFIIMGKVGSFELTEDKFSYTSKEHVGNKIPPKEIALGT